MPAGLALGGGSAALCGCARPDRRNGAALRLGLCAAERRLAGAAGRGGRRVAGTVGKGRLDRAAERPARLLRSLSRPRTVSYSGRARTDRGLRRTHFAYISSIVPGAKVL